MFFRKVFARNATFILLMLLLLMSCSCSDLATKNSATDNLKGWDLLPEILSRIVPPTFPTKDFVITEYGAIGDGKTDCTDAFKQAIENCHAAGVGRVIVPEGIFLTGAIHLKSNVNLHVCKNATLFFSKDLASYLPVVLTRFEGVECMNYSPFIYAYEQENIGNPKSPD